MRADSVVKRIVALLFVTVLFVGFIKNGSYNEIQKMVKLIKQDVATLDPEAVYTVDTMESDFAAKMYKQQDLIDLNGTMASNLHMQGFFGEKGIYVTDDKYIVSASDYTDTEYEFEQVVDLKAFLDSYGINLLYVNEPTKYTDDALFREEFGLETYSNRNADLFLAGIKDAGVNTIDLRETIVQEGLDPHDLFYRTDHHWTTKAGLWAARTIAGGLNEFCGYSIDTSLYDEANFTFNVWPECWLGEQGRVVAQAYVGLDDFIETRPNYATSYTFKYGGEDHPGTFDDFINPEIYNLENSVYENESWHYSYRQLNSVNHLVDAGKVLIVGDSYEQVMEPFFSLGVHEVDSLILRNYDDTFSLRTHILENGYDTVVIAYAQFMIGAHDDETSANYRMFRFDY